MPVFPRTRHIRFGAFAPALLAAAVLISSVISAGAPSRAAAAVKVPLVATAAVVSTSHPYSAPIWYPIRDEVYLDCVRSNPGCTTPGANHGGWTMDMVLETVGVTSVPRNPGVYAMGAGRLHIGDANGPKCTTDGKGSFGTWVWIDHGGGVISRYGHLSKILVAAGSLVHAGQEIGIMGTTGKGSNCSVPYVDFQVRHGGVSGTRVQMKTLRACDLQTPATTYRTWPTYLDARAIWRSSHPVFDRPAHATHYSVWNDVPQRSVDFPAVSGSCIPSGTPQTPSEPTSTTISRSGSGQLTVHWAAPAAADKVTGIQVQLAEYHTSTHSWDYEQNEQFVTVPATATSYEYSHLLNGRPYRAQVTFMNSSGNSETTSPITRVPAAKPAPPIVRHAFVTQAAKTASLHFQWSRGKERGVLVEYYQVQVRRVSPKGATAWAGHRATRGVTHFYWPGMRKHAKYVMRIRAVSSMGATAFVSRTVKT